MTRSRNLVTALAALLLAVPSLQAVDLQSVAGADTKLRVYGFVHIIGTYFVDEFQSDTSSHHPGSVASSFFYNNPADQHALPDNQFQIQYAPTRLGFASTTATSSLGDISTKIEMDFNGTNYPHTRLALIDIGNWEIGQAWSTWVDGDAGPDTVDWAGPIGAPCFDTPRFPLIRYTAKIDKNNTLAVSAEENDGFGDAGSPVAAAVPSKKMPTFVGAYTYSADWGHVGLRALAQNYSLFVPAGAGTAIGLTGSKTYSKMGSAVMLSGDVKFGKDDLVYNVYTGSGVGQYGTGFQEGAAIVTATRQDIILYKNTGWMAGYTHNWTDAVRSNLILSGVSYSSDSDIPTTENAPISATVPGGTDIKSGLSGNINTFVKLAKNCELGMEYVYESAKAFNSANVWVDKDNKPVNKNNASKLEVTLHVGF
jgi:hypothetical protein